MKLDNAFFVKLDDAIWKGRNIRDYGEVSEEAKLKYTLEAIETLAKDTWEKLNELLIQM